MIVYDEGVWKWWLHGHQDTGHSERWLAGVFSLKGSIVPVASLFALPSVLIVVALCYLEQELNGWVELTGGPDKGVAHLWRALTTVTVLLLNFRTIQALGRFWEGTGLLHQMRGEWFDAISCLMAFSRPSVKDRREEVQEFRHTLVRLTSLMHGCALHEVKDVANETFEVLDLQGIDSVTLAHLQWCRKKGFNLVDVILHQIQVLVTENNERGVLKIAPPILSRVYQQLSRGMVNLHNAKKITDTQFPFPYVQLIMLLLWMHSLTTPLYVASFARSVYWSACVTFMPCFGMYAVNFVATELEMPFGDDDNDLPVKKFQREMNESLLSLVTDGADHMPSLVTERSQVAWSFEDMMSRKGLMDIDQPHEDAAPVPVGHVPTLKRGATATLKKRTRTFDEKSASERSK